MKLCDRCKKYQGIIDVEINHEYESAGSAGFICEKCAKDSGKIIGLAIGYDYYEDARDFMSSYVEENCGDKNP